MHLPSTFIEIICKNLCDHQDSVRDWRFQNLFLTALSARPEGTSRTSRAEVSRIQPKSSSSDDKVSLAVDVKNVDQIIIKIYELNV